jgi:hypothetical protein
MSAAMHNQDLPPELRKQAKGVFDKLDALLSLQDAQARKEQRDKQPPAPPTP